MQFTPKKLKKIRGTNRKGKTHLKEAFQPCLYFGNFCGGGGRIGNQYINNNKNKWIGFSSNFQRCGYWRFWKWEEEPKQRELKEGQNDELDLESEFNKDRV